MGYVVVHRDGESKSRYDRYLSGLFRQLLPRGQALDRVQRVSLNGSEDHWLYVSDNEGDARELAQMLDEGADDVGWEIRPVNAAPSTGPLHPLTIEAGWGRSVILFSLCPLTRWILEERFPNLERFEQVNLRRKVRDRDPSREEIRELANETLPLLVRLTHEVRQAFGGFQVIDPVKNEILVSRVLFHS